MANARTVTTTAIKTNVRYELRDADKKQYTDSELLAYLNKCNELIYNILVESNSELVCTGSGSLTLAAGTEAYDLAANTMGDMLCLRKLSNTGDENRYSVYLTDASGNVYPPLDMVAEEDRYDHLVSGSSSQNRPTSFYLDGDSFGFLPVPDAVYTATLKYFPNFVELASGDNMPYRNLFNRQIEEAIILLAKNRENAGMGIEPSLMQLFQDRAMTLMRQRRMRDMSLRPRKR